MAEPADQPVPPQDLTERQAESAPKPHCPHRRPGRHTAAVPVRHPPGSAIGPAAPSAGGAIGGVHQAQTQEQGKHAADGLGGWRGMHLLALLAVEQQSWLHRPGGWQC